ncbi:MAG: polymer-forming cytoskeletal protein [Elusimicrobiota bacterium]|nr:polymer-forming cytoskeletal protein [Elusimicrobiota bacterium]
MKNIKRYALFAVALVCLGQAAQAARRELTHEDVVIEKGQTVRGDVATDKSILVNGTLDGDAVSVGGASVTINGELTGDLIAIGGAIYVPGLVKGDVSGIGGPVSVSGKVRGDVASVGGGVDLSGTGEIDGGISVLGGAFVKGEKALHKGELHSFDTHAVRTVLPRVLKLVRYAGDRERGQGVNPWMVGGLVGLGLLFFFSMLATGAVLLLLPAVFFPKNVENAAAVITGDMWRACGIGALMLVGFFPGLLMMVVSVLGIPLVPFALMVYVAAGVLGLSAFSVVLQGRFFEGIKKTGPAGLPGKVAAGYGIMAGLMIFGKIIPLVGDVLSLIGFMLLSFGAMLGLGAAWMTRMGNQSRAVEAPPVAQPVTQQLPPPVN